MTRGGGLLPEVDMAFQVHVEGQSGRHITPSAPP